MGPTIILDKSSLQALSKKELVLLNKLYFVNIPPVLTVEILADLKKTRDPSTLNEAAVIEIANKLIQSDNAINEHYLNLVISSLLGVDYIASRKTLVGGGRRVKDKNGKMGVQFIETPEQAAIRNWQRGDFTQAEKILATQWRTHTTGIDLNGLKEMWTVLKTVYPECNDYISLLRIAENWLNNPNMQSQLLILILEELKLDHELSSNIYYRWEGGGQKLLKDFAPYFYHVSKVDIAFRLGLVYNLITTRSTNQIDCEYVYYLPYCNIFTSRDNFHKSFVPHFLADDQIFVDGDELKADLNNMVMLLEKEDAEFKYEWGGNFSLQPPDDEASFTYKMWKKYLASWSPGWFYKKHDLPKTNSKIVEELNERVTSFEELESNPFGKLDENEIDFISIEKHISLEDQCICGSGRRFKECCYREGMKFDK